MSPLRPEIVVDDGALARNVARLTEVAQGAALIAVVKADGYGHGLVPAAGAMRAGGAPWLATATPAEALALRAAGDEGPLLCWLTVPADDLAPVVAAGVDVTAYSLAELAQVADAVTRTGRPARLQLKVDTGLSRGGAAREQWRGLFAEAARGEAEGRWRVTGVWSHLACADDPAHPANDAQEQAFREALEAADAAGLEPEVRHLANSAGTVLRPSARFDAVRCGIATYGLDPAPGHTDDLGLDLEPAMTVRAPLALVKRLEPGDGVSYGHTFTADRPMTVGLVPVGYGDGLPRHASNRAQVWVGGRRRPLLGRVCMDQVVVEVGDGAAPGDEVVLFGPGDRGEPTAQDWAEACETINYEIVTRIGGRLPRRHVTTSGRSDRVVAEAVR
ncbi:alanine racemase [Nocardioides nanhaiensis]|uniref:Alanine racemase n=1 Tax=Nocardioides nanhaiensis TaxID=1476871 RepID=A0ABP8VZX7_9ACTN